MSSDQAQRPFDAATLMDLQPSGHLELLEIVDKLRAQGLNEHVDLPQLIVCGDQSSGKSSVLSAISGVPFPKKDNLCTRFATEVILRRDDDLQESHLSVTITPSSIRDAADRRELAAFARNLSTIEELPIAINEAAVAMGLSSSGSAFSADILRLEVRGPKMPQLTIVDLPGLVHAPNKFQSAEDIVLVHTLVEGYMSQERSIILAVVSAKNDYANQIVLEKAKKLDPEGRRTLGIITKPDALYPGSEGETSFLGLARNQDIHFSLGWHVVRNQDSNKPDEQAHRDLEDEFFRGSRFGHINVKHRGIHALRERLSEVLFHQIQRELPSLIAEIMDATTETAAKLERMGRSRATAFERRNFVMDLGQRFGKLCFAACEGLYEAPFFEESETSTSERRLRAVVQNDNINFAARMREESEPAIVEEENSDALSSSSSRRSSSPVLRRAKQLVQSWRGKELPGTFNPALIGQLFRDLSSSWLESTIEHVEDVWYHARKTVVAILDEITERQVRDVCMKRVIDPRLDTMRKQMKARLEDYMQAYRRQPITYNHYLTDNVQKARRDRTRSVLESRLHDLFDDRNNLRGSDIDFITNALLPRNEPNMDNVAAQDLADYAEAYYKVALKRVIDEVPAHVIEPAILTPLPEILNASMVLGMSYELIDAIALESAERQSLRNDLRAKLEVFERSRTICTIYADRNPSSFAAANDDLLRRRLSAKQGTDGTVPVKETTTPEQDAMTGSYVSD